MSATPQPALNPLQQFAMDVNSRLAAIEFFLAALVYETNSKEAASRIYRTALELSSVGDVGKPEAIANGFDLKEKMSRLVELSEALYRDRPKG